MSSNLAGPVPSRTRSGQVDGDVLVAAAGVPPDVLINADHPDSVEACSVADQHPSASGQHGVVGGVPGNRQPGRPSGAGRRSPSMPNATRPG